MLSLCYVHLEKTEHAFSNSLHKNCRTCVVFFSLATSDNLTQLLIVRDFLFSISGAHTGCFRLQGTFYCIASLKKNKKKKQRLQFYKLCKVLILNGWIKRYPMVKILSRIKRCGVDSSWGGGSKVEVVTHRFKLFWHVTVIPFGPCGKQKAVKFTVGCGRHGPVLHRNQDYLFPLISPACASE